jgi:cell division protein FtsL
MPQAIDGVGRRVQVASRSVTHGPWARGESAEFLSTIALGVLILAAALLYVWQHTYVVRLGYEVERLRERHAVLVQEHKGLRLELGQLRSLRRVEEIARTRLGMGTPRPGQVILMPESMIQ